MKNGAELDKNPLFEGISQVECEEMLTCFQAVRKRFRVDDLIYDFAGNSVGLIEQGEAVLLRIDEEGVSTVLETLAPGGVFGKTLAFAGSVGDSLEVVCRKPCE